MGFELLRSGKTTSGCGYIHIYPYPSGGYGYGYTTPKILWIWILKGLKIHNHIHWRALTPPLLYYIVIPPVALQLPQLLQMPIRIYLLDENSFPIKGYYIGYYSLILPLCTN